MQVRDTDNYKCRGQENTEKSILWELQSKPASEKQRHTDYQIIYEYTVFPNTRWSDSKAGPSSIKKKTLYIIDF